MLKAKPALMIVLVIATYSISTPQTPDPDRELSSITGVVSNAVSGMPLRRSFARLEPITAQGGARTVITDEEGRFTIVDLLPGNYRLRAEHQGFIESQYGEATGAAIELRLSAGEKLTNVNVKLLPQSVISGRILDEVGETWTHGSINIYRSVWRQGKRRLEGYRGESVDDRGQFRIGQLPPGKYFVCADPDLSWEAMHRTSLKGSVPRLQPTWYPSAANVETSIGLTLTPGQELSGVDVRLRIGAPHLIQGHLSGLQNIPVSQRGGPFSAPRISATPVSDATANSFGGTIRPDGSFEIKGIPSGLYDIKVAQGVLPSLGLGHARVQVDERDIENVLISLKPPRPLKGIVRIEGSEKLKPEDLTVWLTSLGDSIGFNPLSPQADGAFEFAQVAQERVRLLVRSSSRQLYTKLIRYGDAESHDGTFMFSGAEIIEVILSAHPAQLSGVIEPGRSRQSTPQIVLVPDSSDPAQRERDTLRVQLDQKGTFVVRAIPPGAYTMFAFESVPEGAWTDNDFVEAVKSKGLDIRLQEGDAKSVTLPLILRADISNLLARLGIE